WCGGTNGLAECGPMTAYGHSAGEFIECLSIAIQLRKEESEYDVVFLAGYHNRQILPAVDQFGNVAYRVGFKIGGGIDQDPACAPFRYPDQGIYITHIDEDSPAARAGLRRHDKILQVNGLDFTLLTHERAVKYIKKYAVLDMLVARAELPPLHH
ncbi:PDZ/DHR/GLGF domain protein, partial [Teladorsagia circumcincta]